MYVIFLTICGRFGVRNSTLVPHRKELFFQVSTVEGIARCIYVHLYPITLGFQPPLKQWMLI